MDRVVSILVGMGVVGLVLCFLIASVEGAGGMAIVLALVALGPGGMIGGVFTAVLIGLVTKVLAEFGLEALATAVVEGLLDNGWTVAEIRDAVKALPFLVVSKTLKRRIYEFLDRMK